MRFDIALLDTIDVAAPCHEPWDGMVGSDRVRHCGSCRKNVYNLSDMTRSEAESLVRENGAKGLCVKFYRRVDGTILTDNCPVGLRTLRDAMVKRWAAVVSLVATTFHLPVGAGANPPPPKQTRLVTAGWVAVRRVPPFRTLHKPAKWLPWDNMHAASTDKRAAHRSKSKHKVVKRSARLSSKTAGSRHSQ